MSLVYRNYLVLFISMILMFSTAPMVILTAGLVGKDIAADPGLATLPVALMIIGTVSATIPAGRLFLLIGYRLGFIFAALWAAIGAFLAYFSALTGNFPLFCVGTFMLGNNLAFAQQSRFVCLIGIPAETKNVAVSIYLCGGIFAGILGPQLSRVTKDIIQGHEFAGTYLVHVLVLLAGVAVLTLYKGETISKKHSVTPAVSFRTLLGRSTFYYPMLCGMVSYAVMSFVMTATPLSMRKLFDYSFEETALVIQMHLLAMFVPSLFTGIFINRFGHVRIIVTGIFLFFGSQLIAVLGTSYVHFMSALILLGLGWNFMFIAATSLLVKCNAGDDLVVIQSKNDFCIFFGQASAALMSGTILNHFGWINLNLIGFVPVSLVMLLTIFKGSHFRPQSTLKNA